MTNLEAKNEMLRISSLHTATPDDVGSMFNLHQLIYGNTQGLCKTCPGSVRSLFTRLNNIMYQYNEEIVNNPTGKIENILTK